MTILIANPLFWAFIAVCAATSFARLFMANTFRKNLKNPKRKPKALRTCASEAFSFFQIKGVAIEDCGGSYSDRFYPRRTTLCVSQTKPSLCSVALLLHECGHAVLYARHSIAYRVFYALGPVVNSSAWIALPLLLAALISNEFLFAIIAIWIFLAIFIFQLFGFFVELKSNGYAKAAAKELAVVASDETASFSSLLLASSLAGLASVFQIFSTCVKFIGRIIAGPPKPHSESGKSHRSSAAGDR